ncbi:MAG: hypothetical protein JSR33_03850, partial [Proteobacteria bacterium]|nr:hypothetical protein [Pseudomonadota bacterium]
MNTGHLDPAFSSEQVARSVCHPIPPVYADELRTYPVDNPIFMAVDRLSLQRIRSSKGVCLYCPEPAEHYVLNFCFQREVWVLYAHLSVFSRAMDLAQCIQWQGASKTLVLRIGIHHLR